MKKKRQRNFKRWVAEVFHIAIVNKTRWDEKCRLADSSVYLKEQLASQTAKTVKLSQQIQRMGSLLGRKDGESNIRAAFRVHDELAEMRGIVSGLGDVIAGRTKPLAQIEKELSK